MSSIPDLTACEGSLVLHGSVIVPPVGAVGFIAPSRYGKSTLAASFYASGTPILCDDMVKLSPASPNWQAVPMNSTLRLFPDARKAIFPKTGASTAPLDAGHKDKICFETALASAPLVAVFRLCPPARTIHVRRLSPAQGCMAIVANSFAMEPSDPEEGKRRFSLAAEAARVTPVFDLHYPRDFDALPAVHAAISDTLKQPLNLADET